MLGKNVRFETEKLKRYLFHLIKISVELGVDCGNNELKMTKEELIEKLQKENWRLIEETNFKRW